MLKIFATQLSGIFKKIGEEEEMAIEDGARAVSQALVGDGNVYIYGADEMKAIEGQALSGPERFPEARPLIDKHGTMASLTPVDRIILATRFSDDEKVVDIAKKAAEAGAVAVGISAVRESDGPGLHEETDFHIDTKCVRALLPQDDGERIGLPSGIAALFAYYGLYFSVLEIMEEYD
ncbi:DUF2529 family protein [Bacillus marinisedimentorum]|uniref:DUF2529 family protein n=1 Tax=Bacillus marinisedimentorum TaxID=1821260 RepID=UPI0007E167A6|nr:DUF2529 family protein [Bacillus marinisedimentorum]